MPQGYFVIADVTGYTFFLTQSELEHAQEILNTLFDKLLENIQPPLVVSNFQGDAILTYAPEGSFVQGQTLLEILESLYFAFSHLREQMHYNTTCTCNACKNILTLDLKLFVHYGNYIVQRMAGRQELMGPDVILAHRMMKNEVREKTGVKAYALLTATAAEKIALGELCAEMTPYTTTYEHLGEVNMLVHDLRAAFERSRTARQVCVKPEEAHLAFEADFPIPPSLAWDYLTKPEFKQVWLGMDTVNRADNLGGRVREGAQFHCTHGTANLRYTIVDWHPFQYVTTEGIGFEDARFRDTYWLTPTKTGCRFGWCWSFLDEKRPTVEPMYQGICQATLPTLCKLIETDLAAGKIVTSEAKETSD